MAITIGKATETLLDIELRVPQMRPQHERDALRLGREAPRGIIALRCGAIFDVTRPLPGETKE